MIVHPIQPVYDTRSNVLILGSFPSVKSRDSGFFYGHPQNRFWRVIAAVTHSPVPQSIPEKKALLLERGIALWDVIASCEITGSADSSIRQVIPNDLNSLLNRANIHCVCTNGKTADALYRKYLRVQTGLDAVCLPSTSPANASWSLERLIQVWRDALEPHLK